MEDKKDEDKIYFDFFPVLILFIMLSICYVCVVYMFTSYHLYITILYLVLVSPLVVIAIDLVFFVHKLKESQNTE
ncbi:MAG: hypothetical protein DRZ76_03435 [Candidatus Nealsonbacteria bacterium]|nr:MAG: hypothetical protein DRZ76_03435 [Candidatus Nealsonbacteria bacterium]